MGIQIYPTVPVAQAAAEPWPVDDHTIRVDEMFARRLDTEFSAGVRTLLHDPETGLSSLKGEAALEAIAGALPALEELKRRTLAQAMGPRQKALLAPSIDTRLDWATGTIGRLAERATVEVDDRSVAERIAGLQQDAATAWHDPAYLQKLGRAAVSELRWQGERRGWDSTETESRTRAGLSDLYAGAVETAIRRGDLVGAARLYDHALEVIAPERRAAIDRRFGRAREDAFLREVDAALANLPLDPAAPPALDAFTARTEELTPDDATDEVRARLDRVTADAQRRAVLRWHRRQADAGIAALDWLRENPDEPWLRLLPAVRDWLAPDQRHGLERLLIDGRLRTDGDLFERLDRQMVYEPDAFAGVDLDRHRLSLDDEDHTRFADTQKAIAEGISDPAFARYRRARLDVDRTLKAKGVDTDGPVAVMVRADIRDDLHSFETIEGHPPNGENIAAIVAEAIDRSVGEDPPATRALDGAFDPQNIILAANPPAGRGSRGGGGSGRGPQTPPAAPPQRQPAPGPGHNQPPREIPDGLPTAIEKIRRWTQPPVQPPATPTPPDAAGPRAAAEQTAAQEQAATYDIYREHLRTLDPGNPLLKFEPVPGVPPNKVMVENIEKEVDAVIQGKLGRFVFENYDKYPDDKVLNGEQGNGRDVRILRGDKAKAEADFAELSKQATPHTVLSGQHAESQTVLKLPGKDMYVGFRINKEGLPTIDINSPHTGSIRFHYK